MFLRLLGLRSLYSCWRGPIGLFRHLKVGLSVILVFIGVKMLIDPHDHPPTLVSYDIPDNAALLIVLSIIALSVLGIAHRRETEETGRGGGSKPD